MPTQLCYSHAHCVQYPLSNRFATLAFPLLKKMCLLIMLLASYAQSVFSIPYLLNVGSDAYSIISLSCRVQYP